jgi:hypothetical protein
VEAEPCLLTEKLAAKLNSTSSTVHQHLKALGKISKPRKWVPHELTQMNLSQCVNICSSLIGSQEKQAFLDRILTGNENWTVYNNINQK